MKHLLLILSFFWAALSVFAQTVPSDTTKVGPKLIDGHRETPFTPYELYPAALRSSPKLLDIYREKFELSKQDPKEEDAGKLLRSKLRMDVRSLINNRDKFVSYAKQDKFLSTEQKKIINEIIKASFPLLNEKDIDELTSEELIKCINNEAATIGPMVKEFIDKRGGEKNRS